MRFKVPFLVMAVMAIASVGFAQQGQGGGGGQRGGMRGGMMGQFGRGGGGMRLTQLLRIPQVQTELKVTDEQKAKIDELPGGFGGRGQGGPGGGGPGGGGQGGGQGGPGGQRQAPTEAEQLKQIEDDKKAVEAILTPEQSKRLAEIRISASGAGAAALPDVATALGLSADQKAKIKDLQSKLQEANRNLFQQVRDGSMSMEDVQASMTKNNDVLGAEIKKVLTADQNKKLADMAGAPFKLEMQRRPGGGR